MDPIHHSGPCSPLQKLEREETVADLLGISTRHLRNLRAQKLIPFIKLGRAIRLDPHAVSTALQKLTVEVRA
jgi:excisionase family DNA binding protein